MKLQDIGRNRISKRSLPEHVVERRTFDEIVEHNSREPEYTTQDEREIVYYADGSGYAKGGGPCGDLYFDRNGNT